MAEAKKYKKHGKGKQNSWSLGIPEGACVFCFKTDDNEELYGKKYTDRELTVHYFCMLFSSGLCQRGNSEDDGIVGFLSGDIIQEVRRGSRLKCTFCKVKGSTIGCVVGACRKVFHFGCGRENGTLHQFYDSFRSYCPEHRPRQTVPQSDRLAFVGTANTTCAICMIAVEARASNETLRAPCCRSGWYHRQCIQKFALSAGLYFFKCPLCNNKDSFQDEMLEFGIYLPDQDAAWEREPNAYQDLLERYLHCDANKCKCSDGRRYNRDGSKWEILVCDWCGSTGSHVACNHLKRIGKDDVCHACQEIDKKWKMQKKGSTPSKKLKSPEKEVFDKKSYEQLLQKKLKSSYPGQAAREKKSSLSGTELSPPRSRLSLKKHQNKSREKDVSNLSVGDMEEVDVDVESMENGTESLDSAAASFCTIKKKRKYKPMRFSSWSRGTVPKNKNKKRKVSSTVVSAEVDGSSAQEAERRLSVSTVSSADDSVFAVNLSDIDIGYQNEGKTSKVTGTANKSSKKKSNKYRPDLPQSLCEKELQSDSPFRTKSFTFGCRESPRLSERKKHGRRKGTLERLRSISPKKSTSYAPKRSSDKLDAFWSGSSKMEKNTVVKEKNRPWYNLHPSTASSSESANAAVIDFGQSDTSEGKRKSKKKKNGQHKNCNSSPPTTMLDDTLDYSVSSDSTPNELKSEKDSSPLQSPQTFNLQWTSPKYRYLGKKKRTKMVKKEVKNQPLIYQWLNCNSQSRAGHSTSSGAVSDTDQGGEHFQRNAETSPLKAYMDSERLNSTCQKENGMLTIKWRSKSLSIRRSKRLSAIDTEVKQGKSEKLRSGAEEEEHSTTKPMQLMDASWAVVPMPLTSDISSRESVKKEHAKPKGKNLNSSKRDVRITRNMVARTPKAMEKSTLFNLENRMTKSAPSKFFRRALPLRTAVTEIKKSMPFLYGIDSDIFLSPAGRAKCSLSQKFEKEPFPSLRSDIDCRGESSDTNSVISISSGSSRSLILPLVSDLSTASPGFNRWRSVVNIPDSDTDSEVIVKKQKSRFDTINDVIDIKSSPSDKYEVLLDTDSDDSDSDGSEVSHVSSHVDQQSLAHYLGATGEMPTTSADMYQMSKEVEEKDFLRKPYREEVLNGSNSENLWDRSMDDQTNTYLLQVNRI